MKIYINEILLNQPKSNKSINSKKQVVTKKKNNSVGQIKVAKKDSKKPKVE